jgi:hypothetical protein
MSVTPERYMHKPMEALRITEENIEEVAAWCKGEVKIYRGIDDNNIKVEEFGLRCIELNVIHPTGRRRAKAFVGDWIVSARTSFKVYNNRAFTNTFKDFPSEKDVLMKVASAVVAGTSLLLSSEDLNDEEKGERLAEVVQKYSDQILDLL